ncbi:HEPN domain-containing protein [Rubrivirga sp. S365]|uniref:HEPN domain-containing protein n=1 Tax=Rubrivirga litoralis TaxID=3075598 RepID=A0ABU3BP48_9BACT|nr:MULTISPECIES: HEPN domain-containing protein [unclassified Rubrivirga]MDT0631069.1 HEPN domain-containing protein [Rubrivirga sp. F394]MDT7855419.1 HEPN domain-containing protein [Rubrivirga sp. S365]
MTDHEHGLALLDLARRDFRTVRAMGDDPAFADEVVGFHAQQAAEKALKAWLAAGGAAYGRTHDLSALLGMLESMGCDVDPFRSLVRLNVFAVRFRYESPGPGTPVESRSVLADDVAELVRHVEAQIVP